MLHFKDEFETQNTKIIRHNIGAFGVNTYILICKATHHAAVIDPGGAVPSLLDALKKENATVDYILFTHAHIDHMTGAEELKNALPNAIIAYHPLEQVVIEDIPDMCMKFGTPAKNMPTLQHSLDKTPEFSIGNIQLRSFHTPGHTPGSVCFYIPEEKIAFTGDTLFRGSVGRTDLKGGSGSELRNSLGLILKALPDDVKILPGHDRYSIMADEKLNNFFLKSNRLQ